LTYILTDESVFMHIFLVGSVELFLFLQE